MLETAAPILVQVLETKMVMAEASANVVGRTNCVRVRASPMRLLLERRAQRRPRKL